MIKLLIFFSYLSIANANIISKDTEVFAVSVIKNDKVISREITGKKADFNTMFSLNSMSKQFTAAAILLLEEEQKLSVNDKISKFFPELSSLVGDSTILNLITHSAGIPDYLNDPRLDIDEMAELGEKIDFNYVMKYIITHKISKIDQYSYSNSGYVLLAKIIEKVSGLNFSSFMEKNIFKKLKMNNTFILHSNGRDQCAKGHTSWPVFLPKERDAVLFVNGDVGICSNILDYEKWIIALEQNKVFSNKNTAIKFTEKVRLQNGNPVTMSQPVGQNMATYGYGWRHAFYKNKYPIMWHPGDMRGSNSIAIKFIDKDIWIVLFSNSDIADIRDFGIEVGLKIISELN